MKKIILDKIDTRAPQNITKEEALQKIEEMKLEIIELQRIFYASWKNSILIVLQWMDASWKDWVVKKVLAWINPLGIRVSAFWKPNDEEYSHDFLWRLHKEAPRRWMIRVFNRSYYEDVLVPSVEWFLDKDRVEKRHKHIKNYEEMLSDEGTIILKFFLHMSKKKQKERLLERITLERKFWKYDPSDTKARESWDEYMKAYEKVFEKTNSDFAPWYIVPTDQKWYKVYFITKVLLETLRGLNLQWPKLKNHPWLKCNKDWKCKIKKS